MSISAAYLWVLVPGLLLVPTACTNRLDSDKLATADSLAIAEEIGHEVRAAYDLTRTDLSPVERFMSLYPDEGSVVSATAGRITTTRDSLRASIDAFWTGVGQYMIDPTWRWDALRVDVLTPEIAMMTAAYTVPHRTDRGDPHVIGGTWSAVWTRQRAGDAWRIRSEHLSDMPRAVAERLEAVMRADSTKHH
jgi:hypothetical protein